MASSSASTPVANVPLLVKLRGMRPVLSPAEDRVAEIVVSRPREAAAKTISELAIEAKTSETTVLRFCKRLGLRGYPQLRLALAEESAPVREERGNESDISARDSVDDVVAKAAYLDSRAVEETADRLDRAALAAAAAAIATAGRIDIYGIAASAIVGADLQQKLHRIGAMAFVHSDPHIALTGASLLNRKDVAIAISHSGTTKETVEALRLAGQRKATTIAITNFPHSPLAQAADIVLVTAARETMLRSGATASRIAALLVVDCLYLLVAQRNLARSRRAVQASREAVSAHHVRN